MANSSEAQLTNTWWDQAGLGILIHWGVYSVTAFHTHPTPTSTPSGSGKIDNGSEWYFQRLRYPSKYGFATKNYHEKTFRDRGYYDLADDFATALETKFDAKVWAKAFAAAGARYVIITSRHHDGFCLWPTKHPSKEHKGQPWCLKRDVLMELKLAVEALGIKFGLYYSLLEWGHPLFDKEEYVETIILPQLIEIIDRYKPEVLWADGDWGHYASYWKSDLILKWYKMHVPSGITNDRWGKWNMGLKSKTSLGDYKTYHDRALTGTGRWEAVHPIGQGWAYNTKQPNYKSPLEVYQLFHQVRTSGGNLLLGVGPRPDGSLVEEELTVLTNWLKTDPLWSYSEQAVTAVALTYSVIPQSSQAATITAIRQMEAITARLRETAMKTKEWWTLPEKPLFHHAISLVTSQEHRFEVGRAIRQRLYALATATRSGGGILTPEFILSLSDTQLTEIGLAPSRWTTIRTLAIVTASTFPDGNVEKIAAYARVHGVGPWTVKGLKILSNAEPNVALYEDKWIRARLAQLDSVANLSEEQAQYIFHRYHGYETMISSFLWRLKPLGMEHFKAGTELTRADFL